MTEPPAATVPDSVLSGSVAGLARAPEVVTLGDGETFELDIRPVRKPDRATT
jgi:hypothetical protein